LLALIKLCKDKKQASVNHLSSLSPLTYHHLFHHSPSFTIEVVQFGVFGLDLFGIDLGCRGDHMFPPRHLVALFKMNLHLLLILNGPRAVIQFDILA
jgi:hypothetical protein